MFRDVLAQWPSGVTVVTTLVDGVRHGMTASSFSSVSLDPPLVSICLDRTLYSHGLISAQRCLRRQRARQGPGRGGPPVRRHGPRRSPTGSPARPGRRPRPACRCSTPRSGWLDCRVVHEYPGGDHTIFVGEVLAGARRAHVRRRCSSTRAAGASSPTCCPTSRRSPTAAWSPRCGRRDHPERDVAQTAARARRGRRPGPAARPDPQRARRRSCPSALAPAPVRARRHRASSRERALELGRRRRRGRRRPRRPGVGRRRRWPSWTASPDRVLGASCANAFAPERADAGAGRRRRALRRRRRRDRPLRQRRRGHAARGPRAAAGGRRRWPGRCRCGCACATATGSAWSRRSPRSRAVSTTSTPRSPASTARSPPRTWSACSASVDVDTPVDADRARRARPPAARLDARDLPTALTHPSARSTRARGRPTPRPTTVGAAG